MTLTPMKIYSAYRFAVSQTPVHSSTVYGKLPALFFCAAAPNQLTAALCHCIYTYDTYTYEDLLCLQICSQPNTSAQQHCLG